MPRNITVTFEDGTQHVYQNAPDEVTPEQVQARASQDFGKSVTALDGGRGHKSRSERLENLTANVRASWSDLPGNILPSAGRFLGGIATSVAHPIDTASNLFDAAAGGLRNAMPEGIRSAIDSVDTPENQAAGVRASETANQVGQFYKDRYGSLENARNSVITDPVGVASDAAAVLAGGAGLAKAGAAIPKVGPALAKTGEVLSAASDVVNPLTVAGKGVSAIARGGNKVLQTVFGLTTGVGSENIAQAAKAGAAGNADFLKNLKGDTAMTDVLDRAKAGLAEMTAKKSAEYRSNMAAVSGDKTVLDFAGIDKAVQDASAMVSFNGMAKNKEAAGVVQKMGDEVSAWKALDPAEYHTPEGLDALKQRLGGMLESIPYNEKTARTAAGKVYNSVKAEITKQAPVYADTMSEYAAASDQIGEIERALSLGDKAAKDTAIRKLQSLTRNNANANYGTRLELAKQLEEQGGVSLLPSLAGQAMNSWAPRSLSGQGAGLATLGVAAFHNPLALAAVPLQSPKAVGLGAYGAGRVFGAGSNALARLGVTPQAAARAGLTANQLAALANEKDR